MLKKLLCLILLFAVLPSPQVYAQESPVSKDFSASFEVDYVLKDAGPTRVTQKISLTNLTANYYAKEYNLSIGSTKIENVTASDSLGKINARVDKKERATNINLTFNDKVVGLNRSLNFNLSYDVSDIAVKNGQIWEITIPKLAISADIKNYNLRLLVPQSFGDIHYISPNPVDVTDGANRVYRFSRAQLEKTGVSAAFGKFQLYDFELKYHLLNPNIFSGTAQITLPPDTNSQQVLIDSIDPKPIKMETDIDGNYLATYQLSSRQKLDIVAKGTIKLVESSRDLQKLPVPDKATLESYLGGNRYWNLDPVIKNKAEELTKNLKDKPTEDKAKALYDYVSGTLKYDYERLRSGNIERLGALGALNNPDQAICMEFTDLFIALARSIGIPAREVNGYAFTQNKDLKPTAIGGKITSDILHAWPEYFNMEKQRWVQIDPTWGSTTGGVDYFYKLDTGHITFIRKGVSADEPLPAGAYKIDAESSGDVSIKPGATFAEESPQLKLSLKNSNFLSGFTSNATAVVKNAGKRAVFGTRINLLGTSGGLITPAHADIGAVLPFGEREYTFKIKSSNLLSTSQIPFEGEVVASNGNEDTKTTFSEQITLQPFFTFGFLPYFFGGLLLLIIVFVFFLIRKEIRAKPV